MNDTRHVLLVARWPVGGIKTYLRYMFGHRALQGYRYTLIAPDAGLEDFIIKAELPITYRSCAGGGLPLFAAVAAELNRESVNLIHSHGFTAGILVEPLATLFRIPHLMTMHDVMLEAQFVGLRGRVKQWTISKFLSSIDRINPVSNDAKENLLEFMPEIPGEKVFPILNGVDITPFAMVRADDLRKRLGLSEDVALVGFFGRFMAQKGFRYLVDAVEYIQRNGAGLRPFKVLTYGWGGFAREDYAEIGRRGLGGYFVQMPYTDNMPAAIKAMDMVVMPSLWEACGLVAMEVLSAGVPLIGSNCIGLREVLEDTPALVVPPRNHIALAAALTEVLANNPKKEFAAFAPEARRRFDVGIAAAKLADLYRKFFD